MTTTEAAMVERTLVTRVDELLDLATSRHYDTHSDETLTECHLCGDWEGHTDECPVPALKKWLDANE